MSDPLLLSLVFLAAMVVTVPLARKAGLGSVLGYLIAGAVLGPSVTGVLSHGTHDVLHFAEFGVIMMLFLIGLELKPSLLWKMRVPIFGLGGMQVLGTTALFAGLAIALGLDWRVSVAAAMIISLSSTAIVLQTLQEKGALKTTGGETSFAVLLFQDVAVIPIITILPLLGTVAPVAASTNPWWSGANVIAAVALVVVAGKWGVPPLFRIIGASRLRELFTALALLLVLAVTVLMNIVGLSPALGAFLGGVVLAESEYRHQLETDIEPFKGLLLGVFFISVGAGIDFGIVAARPGFVLGIVAAIVLGKGWVLYALGWLGRLRQPDRLLFAFSLAQGGEFAFVLLNFAARDRVLDVETSGALTAAIALSMFTAPLMIQGYLRWIQPRFAERKPEREADHIDDNENPVIVAGFGRFGQMVVRLLRACGIKATILDYDVEQIEVLGRFGFKGFYGDASQMDLLRAAGAAQAKVLIIAIDDREKALQIIDGVTHEFPHLKILARAYDRLHAYEMIHRGVMQPVVETAGSGLQLGIQALRELGFPAKQAVRSAQIFKRHNDRGMVELAKLYHETDRENFIVQARNWIGALEGTLSLDMTETQHETDRSWESAPRQN